MINITIESKVGLKIEDGQNTLIQVSNKIVLFLKFWISPQIG